MPFSKKKSYWKQKINWWTLLSISLHQRSTRITCLFIFTVAQTLAGTDELFRPQADVPSVVSTPLAFPESIPSTNWSPILVRFNGAYWTPFISSSSHDTPACLECCYAKWGRWWSQFWLNRSSRSWGDRSLLPLISVRDCWGSSQTCREEILVGNRKGCLFEIK